ncbi:MAG: GntR family transcriptional regulator [Thermodesulfobacteriota bacterium]
MGKKKKNSRREIFIELSERISDGYISPGVKLIEQELSSEFGVSRPVIREILSQLEAQGLVKKVPNKGTVVCKIDPGSLFEIFEIREVIEGLAARKAAQNTTAKDWKDLEKKFGAPGDKIVQNKQFEEYLSLVTEFRKRIVSSAQSKELSALINSIYAKIRIVQRRVIILPGRIEKGIIEHREVLNAIMKGDPDMAESMKRNNLHSALKDLKRYKKWVF